MYIYIYTTVYIYPSGVLPLCASVCSLCLLPLSAPSVSSLCVLPLSASRYPFSETILRRTKNTVNRAWVTSPYTNVTNEYNISWYTILVLNWVLFYIYIYTYFNFFVSC